MKRFLGRSLLVVVAFGLMFAMLELIERKRMPAAETSFSHRILSTLPHKERFIADRSGLPRAYVYYDYWIYAYTPYTSTTFNITDYYSTRKVPDSAPLGEGDMTVWMFGGSTLANIETTDELTIANTVAKQLRDNGLKATVVNFGMAGFHSSLELVKFQDLLRRSAAHEKPDCVVFYDGYNDPLYGASFGAGNMQGDLSFKLRSVVEKDYLRYFMIRVSDKLSARSQFWDKHIGSRILNRLVHEKSPVEDVARAYEDNMRIVGGICDAFGMECLYVLQPLLMTKKPRTAFEQDVYDSGGRYMKSYILSFYDAVRQRMQGDERFVVLANLLDGRPDDDFFDECHTGPFTGVAIGEQLGKRIAKVLEARD